MAWRHVIVGIVVVLWTADIIGNLIHFSTTNPALHGIFLAVLAWALGIEVGAIGHRKRENGDDQ